MVLTLTIKSCNVKNCEHLLIYDMIFSMFCVKLCSHLRKVVHFSIISNFYFLIFFLLLITWERLCIFPPRQSTLSCRQISECPTVQKWFRINLACINACMLKCQNDLQTICQNFQRFLKYVDNPLWKVKTWKFSQLYHRVNWDWNKNLDIFLAKGNPTSIDEVDQRL